MESIKTKKDILEIVKFNKKISLLSFSESLKEIMKAKNKTAKEWMINTHSFDILLFILCSYTASIVSISPPEFSSDSLT